MPELLSCTEDNGSISSATLPLLKHLVCFGGDGECRQRQDERAAFAALAALAVARLQRRLVVSRAARDERRHRSHSAASRRMCALHTNEQRGEYSVYECKLLYNAKIKRRTAKNSAKKLCNVCITHLCKFLRVQLAAQKPRPSRIMESSTTLASSARRWATMRTKYIDVAHNRRNVPQLCSVRRPRFASQILSRTALRALSAL